MNNAEALVEWLYLIWIILGPPVAASAATIILVRHSITKGRRASILQAIAAAFFAPIILFFLTELYFYGSALLTSKFLSVICKSIPVDWIQPLLAFYIILCLVPSTATYFIYVAAVSSRRGQSQ